MVQNGFGKGFDGVKLIVLMKITINTINIHILSYLLSGN